MFYYGGWNKDDKNTLKHSYLGRKNGKTVVNILYVQLDVERTIKSIGSTLSSLSIKKDLKIVYSKLYYTLGGITWKFEGKYEDKAETCLHLN